MPRNGSGVYSAPAGTTATASTTIESAKYNAFVADLVSDANTARPVVAGGTGATTPSAARTALGLDIGTDVQAYNANLASLAAQTLAANKGLYSTAADTLALFDLTAAGRALLDDADAAAQRTTLGATTVGNAVFVAANEAAARTAIGFAAGLNASGSAPIYACRAWVRFNGTGTVAIQASGNVSSITDRGTGAYTVNFTTAMEDADYGFAATAGSPAANTAAYAHAANGIAPTASALAIDVITDGGSRQDAAYVAVAVFR